MREFDHRAVAGLLEDEPDEAFRLCNEHLRLNPSDASALFIVGHILAKAERFCLAWATFKRCVDLQPRMAPAWNNLAMSMQECGEFLQAREAFKRAVELSPAPEHLANLGANYSATGNYSEAKRWCRKALEKDPEHSGAMGTLGFAHLATGDWANGWAGYEHCLGGRFRMAKNFTGEPKWDGSEVDSLVVYGEQGLGDEIMFASCLPDALQRARSVTLECDQRLEGLLQRSFPTVEVHGTRRVEPAWAAGRTFDAGAAVGSLPSLFRRSPDDCPRTPYLVADPERRLQWRALFDSWGRKPVIGLAWSGGRAATQVKERQVGLEAFRSLIERTDAHFVSLQYKDPSEEIEASGLPVKHYHRAVQSPDYDDCAAFVAELDCVVGVHTTVHHLAGALGVPGRVLVPSRPMWNYAHGEEMPWYRNMPFHRQKKGETWAECVARLEL